MVDYYKELDIDRNLSFQQLTDELDKLEAKWIRRETVNQAEAWKTLALISDARNEFQSETARKLYDARLSAENSGPVDSSNTSRPDSGETVGSRPDNNRGNSPEWRESNQSAGRSDNNRSNNRKRSKPKKKRRDNYDPYQYIESRGKSFYSVFMVALAVISIIVWVVLIDNGMNVIALTNGIVWTNDPLMVGVLSFGVLFLLAGFPWGWSMFWPFWNRHLSHIHFFVISIIRWPLLFVFCLAFGWISMLFHIPTIIRAL